MSYLPYPSINSARPEPGAPRLTLSSPLSWVCLTMQPRLVSNSQSSFLRLLSARVTGVHYHTLMSRVFLRRQDKADNQARTRQREPGRLDHSLVA